MSLENIIGSVKKVLKSGILAGAMVALPQQSAKAEEKPIHLNWGANISYEQNYLKSVSDIPFEMRNVPIHEQDSEFSQNAGPIPDGELNLYDRLDLGLRLGFDGTVAEKTQIGAGVGLSFNLDTDFWDYRFTENRLTGRTDIQERNYTNRVGSERRGEDSALTYYRVYQNYGLDWNTFLRPIVYLEVKRNFSDKLQASIGSKFFYQKLILENGWDRNDELNSWNEYNLADYIVAMPSVSVKFLADEDYAVGAELGMTLPLLENKGEDVNIEKSMGVWGGINLSFGN